MIFLLFVKNNKMEAKLATNNLALDFERKFSQLQNMAGPGYWSFY